MHELNPEIMSFDHHAESIANLRIQSQVTDRNRAI